jgi:transcription termination/antitermination protein NusG
MTNWYAVYTRPRYERKVAESFARKKIESYCPLNSIARQWGMKKVLQTPLFPSYVFVKLDEAQLQDVRKIDGVISLAYWLTSPIIIRDIEIEMIKRFLEEHMDVQLEAIPVDLKAIVKISYDNVYESVQEGQPYYENTTAVKLLLPSLGRALVAATQTDHIKVITEYKYSKRFNLSF